MVINLTANSAQIFPDKQVKLRASKEKGEEIEQSNQQMIFLFCFLLLVKVRVSLGWTALERYLDVEQCKKDTRFYNDVVKVRQTAGHLIRICDEAPLSTLKFEHAVKEIAQLRPIIFNPKRLTPIVKRCMLGTAVWEFIQQSIPVSLFISNLSKKSLNGLYKKYFIIENEMLRTKLDNILTETSEELKKWELGSADDILDVFFNKKHGIDLSFVPKEFSDSLKIFLLKYFNSVDFQIKKSIIAALVEMPPGTSIVKAFFAALNECGPTVQKIFQLLMDEVANRELNDIHIALKTLCKPMSEEDLAKVILKVFGKYDIFFNLFPQFNFTAVAAATVGQGHLARLEESGPLVFVKIKKYQIEQKMILDFDLMHKVAVEHPKYENIYKELQTNLAAEMNWTREIENTRKAIDYYHKPEYGIYVPKIHSSFPAENPQLIVMEHIEGIPLVPFIARSKVHCCTLVALLKNFYKIWWEEAIYKSGFMHADIHGGNLMYQFNEENPEKSRLYVIDYGNIKELDRYTRESVIEIALGVYINDPVSVADGLGRRKYPHRKEFWDRFIVDLTLFMNSPQVKSINKDERITLIIKYITSAHELENAQDILIFFRAKALFDGIFKYLDNNYGPMLQEYGCPIPKTNALARDVAFWTYKNLCVSAVYGRRPLVRYIFWPAITLWEGFSELWSFWYGKYCTMFSGYEKIEEENCRGNESESGVNSSEENESETESNEFESRETGETFLTEKQDEEQEKSENEEDLNERHSDEEPKKLEELEESHSEEKENFSLFSLISEFREIMVENAKELDESSNSGEILLKKGLEMITSKFNEANRRRIFSSFLIPLSDALNSDESDSSVSDSDSEEETEEEEQKEVQEEKEVEEEKEKNASYESDSTTKVNESDELNEHESCKQDELNNHESNEHDKLKDPIDIPNAPTKPSESTQSNESTKPNESIDLGTPTRQENQSNNQINKPIDYPRQHPKKSLQSEEENSLDYQSALTHDSTLDSE